MERFFERIISRGDSGAFVVGECFFVGVEFFLRHFPGMPIGGDRNCRRNWGSEWERRVVVEV